MPLRVLHYVLDELPKDHPIDGMTRSAIRGDHSLLSINWLAPGHEVAPPHSHPFDQVALIISGAMEFEVEGEIYLVRAGEVLQIPKDAVHNAWVVGDEPALNIDVFAPIREDYRHLTNHQAGEFEEPELPGAGQR